MKGTARMKEEKSSFSIDENSRGRDRDRQGETGSERERFDVQCRPILVPEHGHVRDAIFLLQQGRKIATSMRRDVGGEEDRSGLWDAKKPSPHLQRRTLLL